MVRKKLSFVFKIPYGKQILLISTILMNLALLTFAIMYLLWGDEKKVTVMVFIILYTFVTSAFSYLLLKSRDIYYDDKLLYIKMARNQWMDVPLSKIKEVNRMYYYFYKISFFDNADIVFNEVYYFISPNPTFSKQDELKEVLQYAKNC